MTLLGHLLCITEIKPKTFIFAAGTAFPAGANLNTCLLDGKGEYSEVGYHWAGQAQRAAMDPLPAPSNSIRTAHPDFHIASQLEWAARAA